MNPALAVLSAVILWAPFAYADDVVLIAPTLTGTRKLLSICGDYAIEYLISCIASEYRVVNATLQK